MNRREVLKAAAALPLAQAALASPAFAQGAWPTHNITMIVPFPAGGQADFLQQRFDGFGAFVRPEVALEVAALVLLAGHNRHAVRAGFKSLDQIRNIHLSGTGQTDGLDGVALQVVAKAGKLAGRQIV